MTPQTQPARGMRDFLPADVRRREYVIRTIKDVYDRYGFEPLETPAVERLETLTGKYGEEGNQLIFKILKRGAEGGSGEADLALRYDLTVPLARVVAAYREQLPKFFKRYQIAPVWRADRPAHGRFREFYQCDVDAIGSGSMIVEAELCQAAGDALTALGFRNFTIRLNHRQVLAGVLDRAGVAAEKHADALIALDKLDKIGPEGVAAEFAERGIAERAGTKLLQLFASTAELAKSAHIALSDESPETERAALNSATLGRLVELIGDHEAGARGIEELREILQLTQASSSGSAGARVRIDVSLARGLSYYTGAIMEVNVPDLPGSLGGGGRYDNLVGMFSNSEIPACGFSLGLERIIVVMTEREMFPPEVTTAGGADVLVTVWDEESLTESIALAGDLRRSGLRTVLYPEADKLGKQLKYAAASGAKFAVVTGPDERARSEIALKDLRSGEQRTLKRDEAAAWLRETLNH